MPLEAFSPTSSVVGILAGGVTAVDRSLLLESLAPPRRKQFKALK